MSSVPVSSPTRNIWRAAAGNRPVSEIGSARPSPRSIASRAMLSFSFQTTLFVPSVLTRSASGIGTPARAIDDRTRQKRSRIECVTRSPTIGTESTTRLRRARPLSVRTVQSAKPAMRSRRIGKIHQLSVMNPVVARSIRVGSGSLASSELKKSRNREDEDREDAHCPDRHQRHDAGVHHGRLDLTAGFELPVEVLGQLVQNLLKIAGQLGGLQHPEVDGREDLGMRLGGTSEGGAGLDVLGDVVEGRLEDLVGHLLFDRLDGLEDRDAGLEEGAQLTAEVHQVLPRNLLLRQFELHERLLFLRLLDPKITVVEQAPESGEGRSLLAALDLKAVGAHSDVTELRHGVSP